MMVGGGWWCGGGGWWTAGGRHDFIIKKCFAKIKISLCRVYGKWPVGGGFSTGGWRQLLGGMFPQENEKVQLNYSSKLKKNSGHHQNIKKPLLRVDNQFIEKEK